MNRNSFLKLTVLGLALLPGFAFANDDAWNQGVVYTMDNSTNGNHVLAYQRAADGILSPAGSFSRTAISSWSFLMSSCMLLQQRV